MSAKSKRTTLFAVALMWLTSASCPMSAQQAKKPFSVADAIKAVHLDNNDIRLSPDGKYVVIHYERGRLELNRVEESLRFYRIYDPEYFVTHPEVKRMPAPIWVLTQTA